MHHDRRGLALTAANADAARHYDAMLDGYLAFDVDTGLALKAALKAEPAMPLALATQSYIFKLLGSRAGEERARQAVATAGAAADAAGASERGRLHVAALAAWCADDWPRAIATWDAILARWPHDVLALKLAHYLIFYRGYARGMRESIARVLPHWSKDVLGYGYILGCYAFSLEESGA